MSTEEQAKNGYSLAQQLEALREYAGQEGYEVVEEITDPGESGVSLERPGMDRVRDLVDVGGINVVLAQDRDRIARKPAYNYILQEELAEHGCELKALNDYGDDSPEGKLMRGIQDQFSEYERAKTADRTRRGKLRKAREGKLLRNSRAHYGFKHTPVGDAYVVTEEEMRIVRRIFRQVADGQTLYSIKRSLEREGVPAPEGGRYWNVTFLRNVVLADVYRPYSYAEIEGLVTPEVAARLDQEKLYGIFWFNRTRATRKRVSTLGPNGREYRWRTTRKVNPRDQWIAIPVPDAGVPHEVCQAAREAIKDNRRPSKSGLRESWELSGGILYCGGCGTRMGALASKVNGKLYAYYRCRRRPRDGKEACPDANNYRAEKIEETVWTFVSGLLKDPERLRAGLDELIEQERNAVRTDPKREAEAWLVKLAELDEQRSRAQDLAIEGLLDHDELRAKLAAIEETRETVQRELEALREHRERIEELERDRDALMERYAGMVPEALDALSPEERHRLYKMLRLKVVSNADRSLEVSGALSDYFCQSETVPR